MTAEQQQNIGKTLVKIADYAEKIIPLIRTVGEGMLDTAEPPKKVAKAKTKALPEPEPAVEEPAEEAKQLTLEDVRTVLADKARAGHNDDVKALIAKYGADRLSAIDPSQYEALMKEAEVIGNG